MYPVYISMSRSYNFITEINHEHGSMVEFFFFSFLLTVILVLKSLENGDS